VSLMRLPPSVHGDGDHGFVPMLIGIAKEKGLSAYIDDGNNLWPAVHRLDVAVSFRLALEKTKKGAIYHSVADEGIPFHKIAEAIGRGLNVPVKSKAKSEVEAHFGWFAHFASMNVPSSSKHTQEVLGWKPTQVGLLEDLEKGKYFTGGTRA